VKVEAGEEREGKLTRWSKRCRGEREREGRLGGWGLKGRTEGKERREGRKKRRGQLESEENGRARRELTTS